MNNNLVENDKKKKKILYCSNCGNIGHNFKFCLEPISSYGIILININKKYKDKLLKKIILNQDFKSHCGINLTKIEDIENFYYLKDKIKFLLIRRRHTLGFIEFIRGRYKVEHIDGIIHLFQQMTKEEISDICDNNFKKLWTELWYYSKNKNNYEQEYLVSEKKFNYLKYNEFITLNLDFYINNVEPTWETAEWGFPKGRRNYMETDIECSKREFEEETNLNKEDYNILNIGAFEENLIGTNGIRYKHIYYLGISEKNKQLKIDINNLNQVGEIGDIGWFSYEQLISLIRPHHNDRKNIITKIYLNLLNLLINNNK
jgi:8-oxo-dGTP pyrophosphatase MutT (NUDIX family)